MTQLTNRPAGRDARTAQRPRLAPLGLAGLLVALALLVPAAGWGAKDVTIHSKTSGGPGGDGTQTLYLTTDKMRSVNGNDETIVDYASGTLTFIERKKKRYWQTTPAEIAAQFEELNQLLEQNPAMARMISGAAAQIEVSKGGTRTIAGHQCTEYSITAGSSYGIDICAATDIETPVNVADAQRVFYATMGPLAGRINKLFDEMSKIGGVPLYTSVKISMMGRDIVSTTEATEVSFEDLGPEVFAIDPSFKKKKSPFQK